MSTEEPAGRIGPYRLSRKIGRGNMGTVYEGLDADGRRLAIKVLTGELAVHEELVERFRREAMAAANFQHPNITSVVRTSANTTHWWFDWETRGFFPFSLPVTMDPLTTMEYTSACSEDSSAIAGCRDGYIRRFHRYHYQDSGANEIESVVDYGPIAMGRVMGDQQGVLAEITGELGADSAPVDFAVRGGLSGEDAYSATADYSATWSEAGVNYSQHPRVGGAAGFVRLTNQTTRPWSVENVRVRLQPMGKNRR